jgi:HEAT repeat protein
MIRSFLLLTAILLLAPNVSAQGDGKFLNRSAEEWARILKTHADPAQRRNAAFALGKMGNRASQVLPELVKCMPSEIDAKAREAIVVALGEVARESLSANADEIEKLLCTTVQNDANPLVRRSAACSLGMLTRKTAATKAALDAALGDDKAEVRQNAAWALGQLGEMGLPGLKRALADADPLVKRDSAGALMHIRDPDKVRTLLDDLLPLCRDANSEVRRAALNVLVQIVEDKDKAAIEPLKAAMQDTDLENKRNAALALSNIGGDDTRDAVPVLLDAIKNGGDVELRRLATLAIRNIGPSASSAVPELVNLLRFDKDAELRGFAAMALGGVGKEAEPAVPFLVEMLVNPSERRDTRIESALAIGRIGPCPASREAVPSLTKVLQDSAQDSKVRERVIWAMRAHNVALREINGVKEAFTKVLGERVNGENRMLRYDCAYMLGMLWQVDAPDAALDVLMEFLKDDTIQLYSGTTSSVGGAGNESVGGQASAKESGKGDGRTMATDALKMIGARALARNDIVNQLQFLAKDAKTNDVLRKKCQELLRGR